MKNLYQLLGCIEDMSKLETLDDFSYFTKEFLEFISGGGMQADIISRNESNYHFYQYKEEGHFCITRPINSELFFKLDDFDLATEKFRYSLNHIREIENEHDLRENINKYIYTCQQCIGSALDAFNNPNKARKRNGLLFEVLIRNVICAVGINVDSGEEKISIGNNGDAMRFQHDVILKNEYDELKAIGQLKTSSKDRLDKIFLDKYMYNRLKGTDVPHFAIFLNDVQRNVGKSNNGAQQYGINSTFLPGHFNAYRIALNPLDGVYYFDLRPSMKTDAMLVPYIKAFDNFIVHDIWDLVG